MLEEGKQSKLKEAVYWCKEAARLGDERAQCSLGSLYEEGRGVRKNKKIAKKLYLSAARKGDAEAQFYLSLMYSENPRKPLYKKELYWLRKSAKQKKREAICNLGFAYANGHGVRINLDLAKQFYLKAAKLGEDAPVKQNDDAVDALRYGIHGVVPQWRVTGAQW